MFEKNENIKINFHFDVNVEIPPASLPELLKLSDKQLGQLKELAKMFQGAAKTKKVEEKKQDQFKNIDILKDEEF